MWLSLRIDVFPDYFYYQSRQFPYCLRYYQLCLQGGFHSYQSLKGRSLPNL
nr:MAG TPA: hypothetical protein [Caudoviricetes sp.]